MSTSPSSSSSRCTDIMNSLYSLTLCPYWSLLLASPLDGIQCLHRANEYKFLLCITNNSIKHQSPSYGLDSITAVLLEGWFWH